MTVAATSLDAYHDRNRLRREPSQRTKVLDRIIHRPDQTREEIALATGLKLSSVCGRVNELMQREQVVISGRRNGANTLRAAPGQAELSL
ncbi:hypothetical protein [Zhongshania sp.]|uniref:hypothetical protein n=1 Tax=Zhongshania sp. TaxID=1971902 RepID=UPI00356894AF